MFRIGCHISSASGRLAMGREAARIGANTFQFFTRNPRGGKAKTPVPADTLALRHFMEAENIGPLLAHAPYTLNACSADPSVRRFAGEVLADDLNLLEALPGNMYVLHPGSHVKQGVETGIALIADALNAALRPDQSTCVLLETMAGKGSEVGSRFEELRAIIDRVEEAQLLGVCLDTCHVFDAGYDITTDPDGVLEEFDRIIGLERLKAVHLNDSKNPLNSRKDRHARIGQGSIGLEAFARIINHPQLRHLPFYLETPNDAEGYAEEIRLLHGLRR